MTHYEALQEIQRIIAAAMPPDSGATVSGLLGDISGPLAAVGLDPISDVQDITDAPAEPCEVIDLFPGRDVSSGTRCDKPSLK